MQGYVLHGVLGVGAHAEVHRAEPADHPGRIVAVKRFHAAPTPASVAEVHREADILARLSHPSIVQLLDVVADGDEVALVTPFLSGGTLADRIVRGPLPAAAVADLGARLGDALAAAHSSGVVHGDVKPSNVLYDAEEQPLLTDFGAAVLTGEAQRETVGSATYLDPEVAGGRTTRGPSSDQYALGVLLYEALAGTPPYAAPTVDATLRAAERGVHVPLAHLVPDAPTTVTSAIETALASAPRDRFATVRELASRLEEARSALDTWTGTGQHELGPRRDGAGAGPPPLPRSGAGFDPPERADRPLPTGRSHPDAGAPEAGAAAGTWATRDADPTRTRRFGPAPPPASPDAEDPRRRVPLVLAAALIALVPLALVLAFVLGDRGTPAPSASPSQAPAPEAAAAACEDAPELPPDAGEPVPADTGGRGCTITLGWDADTQVLTVPRADAEPIRYQLGEPGDVLLVGDWDCDGGQSPGLYRPATGEAFTFDGFAGEGGELESRPARDTGVPDGDPVVTTGEDGCDRIDVRGDA
ncbi:MAG: serine/threonine-protein kinase [Nitriliruptor sp.]